VAVALIATGLGYLVPIVGGPVLAILLGVVVTLVWQPPASFRPGTAAASKQLLQWSIVLLGAHLSIGELLRGGESSLPVMLGTFVIVVGASFVLGRLFGLDKDLRRLLGIGTAICGGSAIAAVSSVIEADQADIAYALGAVFLFNIVAVLIFAPLGHLMHLTQTAFGLWAGTAINDTSSVVASAFGYGREAGSAAVVVKLTRTTLIVPVVLFYVWRRMRYEREQRRAVDWRGILPWFVLWFVLASALNSLGLIPNAVQGPLQQLALFTIVIALAGVGLGTDIAKIRAAGWRPLAMGAVLWVIIACSSLLIARLMQLV
jgi:uncharacterized integral membrane protein (TIGR00698 family)